MTPSRDRLLVAGVAVALGVALVLLSPAGPGPTGGTVRSDALPTAEVTASPGDDDPGTVTVRFAGTGDWPTATLSVASNRSLRVVDGGRTLASVGEAVTLAATDDAGGEAPVRLTVTAHRDGERAVVYRNVVVLS